jgi:hypothetical protein
MRFREREKVQWYSARSDPNRALSGDYEIEHGRSMRGSAERTMAQLRE